MRRSNAVTLKDVALEAGVAKMTASVVLNGARSGTQVSDATRARIQEAAARLGYRPNGVARGLSRRRMDVIGVVARVNEGAGLNLYFLETFNGILDAAARHRQSATVFTLPDWAGDAVHASVLRLCDGRVDGLIFLGPHRLDPVFVESVQQHTPLVAIHAADAPPSLCNVDIDNEGGFHAVTHHLIGLGHRRIAHLPGCIDLPHAEAGAVQRLAGYRRALAEAGIPYDPALVLPGYYVQDSGRERTDRLLAAATGAPPTAFCCANDAIAMGCLEAVRAHGLRVPEDVSVTGFDGVLSSQLVTPPLTTVRQPLPKLGQRAVELLLEQIHSSDEEPGTPPSPHGAVAAGSRTEIFPVELVVRGSAAPPPGFV